MEGDGANTVSVVSLDKNRSVGLAFLESANLSPAKMADQVRALVAYYLQTPEGDDDLAVLLAGFDEEKLEAFIADEISKGSMIPWEIILSLPTRDGLTKILQGQEVPDRLKYKASHWLRQLKKEKDMKRNDVAEWGKQKAVEILAPALAHEGRLTCEERKAIRNMAETIVDTRVINAIIPFAIEYPWIAIHLLNNLGLVNYNKAPEGFDLNEVDFTSVIGSLINSIQDKDIREEFLRIINLRILDNIPSNQVDEALKFVKEDPTNSPEAFEVLLKAGKFTMSDLFNSSIAIVRTYKRSEEKRALCRVIGYEIFDDLILRLDLAVSNLADKKDVGLNMDLLRMAAKIPKILSNVVGSYATPDLLGRITDTIAIIELSISGAEISSTASSYCERHGLVVNTKPPKAKRPAKGGRRKVKKFNAVERQRHDEKPKRKMPNPPRSNPQAGLVYRSTPPFGNQIGMPGTPATRKGKWKRHKRRQARSTQD